MKTVKSAGGVILNENNEVVIVFTNTKNWQFPKGTVEEGESYLETALREIKEETGLENLKLVKELPVYSRVSTHEDNTVRYIHYFLFKTTEQNIKPGAEITECKWVPVDIVDKELTYDKDKQFILENIQGILAADKKQPVNVLITGISGTGKSALSNELQKMGQKAYDLEEVKGLFAMHKKSTGEKIDYHFDSNDPNEMQKYDWICDATRLKALINENKGETVFYCGLSSNINDLVPLFDKAILLIASESTIRHRLTTRTDKYGKGDEIQDWMFTWKDWWEDTMRELGVIEVDADKPLKEVAIDILRKVNG